MKRSLFIVTFLTVNLFFVFFLIYKNSRIVELTYAKQKHEKELHVLSKQKEAIHQELCQAQNRDEIKKFATNELKMHKIQLRDIKQITELNQTVTS